MPLAAVGPWDPEFERPKSRIEDSPGRQDADGCRGGECSRNASGVSEEAISALELGPAGLRVDKNCLREIAGDGP